MVKYEIDWGKMHLIEMPNTNKNPRTLTVTNKGEITINKKLIEKMLEQNATRRVKFWASDDFRMLVIKNDIEGFFILPKTGHMKHMEFARGISKAGYNLPIKYTVEWNEKEQVWMAILQEKYIPVDVEYLINNEGKRQRRIKNACQN